MQRVGAPVCKGRRVAMHGLGDIEGTNSDKYATLDLTFGGRSLKIKGLIVDTICSNINMSNPSITKEMQGLGLTMDFGGQDSIDFEISALIGLDVNAKLISSDASGDVPMKKVNDVLLILIGDKYLPFGNRSSSESIPKRKSLIALSGPSAVKSAFLDVLLKEFFNSESPPQLQERWKRR